MAGIEDMVASLRGVRRLGERTAQIAAPLLDAAVKATAAAGQSPDGKAWAPTKAGGRAMPNAASHIATKAYGDVVKVTLEGDDVYHHFSKKTHEPRRQVIPDPGAGIPPEVQRVLDQASAKAFEELAGGK